MTSGADSAVRFAPGDHPIKDKDQDRLGRDKLAEALAKQVVGARPDEGFVLGLTGSWGSGKTSLLNLLESHLGEEDIAIHFNPWLYADATELVHRFLAAVRAQLPESESYAPARRALARYDGVLAPAAALSFLHPAIPVAVAAGGILARIRTARNKKRTEGEDEPVEPMFDTSAEQARDEVRAALQEIPGRLVVFIDDLDRLVPEEVAEMVRLVKLVGDFPRTSYVLAYDRRHVEKALKKVHGGSGRAYLEKVVQASHAVPHVPPSQLAELLREELGWALRNDDVPAVHEQDRWLRIETTIIMPLMQTMRDIRRFANVLPTALRLTGDDVDAVDVAALEAIRLNLPRLHSGLAEAAPALTRAAFPDFMMDGILPDDKTVVLDLIDLPEPKDRTVAVVMIQRLFPGAVLHLDGVKGVAQTSDVWFHERRVATLPGLLTYLSKAVGQDAVGAALTAEGIAAFGSPARFAELTKGLTHRQVLDLLRRIGGRGSDLSPTLAPMYVATLSNVCDRISYDSQGWADPYLAAVLVPFMHNCVDPHLDAAGESDYRDAYAATTSLSARFRFIQLIDHESDETDSDDAADQGPDIHQVTPPGAVVAELKGRLEQELLDSSAEELVEERAFSELFTVLASAREWAGQRHIRILLGDDRFLLRTLDRFTNFAHSSNGDETATRLHELHYTELADLVGLPLLDALVQRLRERTELDELTSRQRTILDAAVKHSQRAPSLGDGD